jgi:hypothetical protein
MLKSSRDAGAHRLNEGADLAAGQHAVEAGALDVQDLAPQRQDRLIMAVAALLGRAAGRVTLDQEQLGLGGIALLTVGELAGQGAMSIAPLRRVSSRAFLAASRAAAASITFWMTELGDVGILLEPFGQLVGDQAFERLATSELTSLSLVCELNLGSGSLTETMAVRPSRMSSPVRLTFSFFSAPERSAKAVQGAGQRRAERGQVGAAVALRDVVGEAEDLLVIAVVPLQRDVDADLVALAGDGERLGTIAVLARSR